MRQQIESAKVLGYSPVLMIYQDTAKMRGPASTREFTYVALERRNCGPHRRDSHGNWIEIPNPGKLALPGGGAMDGESAYATARRELFEETGQDHSELQQLMVRNLPERFVDVKKRVIAPSPYAVMTTDAKLRYGGEGESIGWYSLASYGEWRRELAEYHDLIIEDGVHSLLGILLIDWKRIHDMAVVDYNSYPDCWG